MEPIILIHAAGKEISSFANPGSTIAINYYKSFIKILVVCINITSSMFPEIFGFFQVAYVMWLGKTIIRLFTAGSRNPALMNNCHLCLFASIFRFSVLVFL